MSDNTTPNPKRVEPKRYTCAETAKLVRAELKSAFPEIKFSVRSETYSGGASITVSWTDGPTSKEIKAVVSKYAGADFDPMIDLKSYVTRTDADGNPVRYGADYVFTSRSYTRAFLQDAINRVDATYANDIAAHLGIEDYQDGTAYLEDYQDGTAYLNPDGSKEGYDAQQLVYKCLGREYPFDEPVILVQIDEDDDETESDDHPLDIPADELEERREAYQEKRQARIDKLNARSAKAQAESQRRLGTAKRDAGRIPFGQPILVGHHSERRDRNFRKRIENNYRKGFEAADKAAEYARRAESAERNDTISSDDPDAIVKLNAKIEIAQRLQEHMKGANKIVKSTKLTDDEKVAQLTATHDLSVAQAKALLKPDFAGRIGYASYQLRNNLSNIKRMQSRVADLKRIGNAESIEFMCGEVRVVRNTTLNRLQLFFPGKPDANVRAKLKSNGFRWAPSVKAWQRQYNGRAVYSVGSALGLTRAERDLFEAHFRQDTTSTPDEAYRDHLFERIFWRFNAALSIEINRDMTTHSAQQALYAELVDMGTMARAWFAECRRDNLPIAMGS